MLVAVAWMAPGVARAQLVTISVQGATEEARAFTTFYREPSSHEGYWTVAGSLVRTYRVNLPAGTVKINAVLHANTPPRIAQGPMSQQSLRLHTAWSDTTLASAPPLPPNQPVEVSYEFPYTADGFGERVVVFSTGSYAAWCAVSEAVPCATIEGFLVFLLRVSPELDISSVRPALVQGPPQYARFQFPVQGMSPLTEVTSVLIDGIPMTRVPESLSQSPGPAEWNRYYPTIDPITPGEVIYPFGEPNSVDRFLGCGGGGCGMGGVTVGLPADLGTGLHLLTVEGSRWPDTIYNFFGGLNPTIPAPGEPAGSAHLDAEEEFIVVDPKISVSPPQAEPGSTITVTGTGFAPENEIPVRFGVHCCSVREPLGTARTDVTGRFTLQATLPTAPFASIWSSSAPPGTTTAGAIMAMLGDAVFLQRYNLGPLEYSGAITFVKPGATPSTTTTTLPVACNPGDACDDGDPCTADACTAGVCTHTTVTGVAAVSCGIPPTGLHPPVCMNEAPPKRAEKAFGKATTSLERAIGRPRRAARRLVKKADKLLKRAQRAVDVAEVTGDLSPSCADGIGDVLDGMRSRLGVVLSGL